MNFRANLRPCDFGEREASRAHTPLNELRAFANSCIALTTKDNYRLYKRLGTDMSSSQNRDFKALYEAFRRFLDKPGDIERARLRRLISSEALAEMSDMMSSIGSESAVEDYKDRKKLAITL